MFALHCFEMNYVCSLLWVLCSSQLQLHLKITENPDKRRQGFDAVNLYLYSNCCYYRLHWFDLTPPSKNVRRKKKNKTDMYGENSPSE